MNYHWTKSRISLCVTTYILASILQRIEPNFLQSVGNVYKIGSILQISLFNKEILLFSQCTYHSKQLCDGIQLCIFHMMCFDQGRER